MEGKARAHTMIGGRVQGVFYRLETQRAASELSLCGWVKNKIDGTVEAVFEGKQSQVEAVLKWCRQGPPRSAVAEVEINWEPFTGKYTTFEIRY